MQRFDDAFGNRRKFLLSTVGIVAFTIPILLSFANSAQGFDQSQPQNTNALAFEYDIVSVKLVKPAPGLARLVQEPDGFTARNVTVQRLIQQAYGIAPGTDDGRIAGGPNWLTTERFDVDAKTESSVAEALQKLSPDEIRIARQRMLQTLLADYFKLTITRETRQLQRYTLSVAKGGPKLQHATPAEVAANAERVAAGRNAAALMKIVRGGVAFQSISMTQLVGFLTQLLEKPVVDETGLTGLYDFTLNYVPDAALAPAPPSGGAANGQPGLVQMDVDDDSSVIAAAQQLGLKLESGKGPVEVIVVTHVEQPSQN